jgi:hypothetical protein
VGCRHKEVSSYGPTSVIFGTIASVYRFPPAFVASMLAALEAAGVSSDYVPTAEIKLTQVGIEQARWFYSQKNADTETWCVGDFVAFSTFCKGDQIPNANPKGSFQIAQGSGAYNLQRGFQIPCLSNKAPRVTFQNVLLSSVSPSTIARVAALKAAGAF